MKVTQDHMVIAGLVINFIVVIYTVVNSKLKLENRLTRMETLLKILMRNSDLPKRRSDDDIT